jgi:hypothetical protein
MWEGRSRASAKSACVTAQYAILRSAIFFVGLGDQPEAFVALELNMELAIGEAKRAQSLSRFSLWAGAAVIVRARITTTTSGT